jgi:hypothetical protein
VIAGELKSPDFRDRRGILNSGEFSYEDIAILPAFYVGLLQQAV